MSFVFRGSRADIEAGFPDYIPERRAYRMHPGSRPISTNSMVLLIAVLLLFMMLNSRQMSPSLALWLVVGVFLMISSLRMYAACQQLQAHAHAHAVANGLLGHTELRLHVPQSIALATRGRLQSLRLQLALLDREFDDLDYDALRALDFDNSPHALSMSEEEINALPLHNYKPQKHKTMPSTGQSEEAYLQQSSLPSSGAARDMKCQAGCVLDRTSKSPEDELTCSICLEQVLVGELVRSLPCLHQFHATCIDPWLRQQGTCPICKHRVSFAWQGIENNGEADRSDMV